MEVKNTREQVTSKKKSLHAQHAQLCWIIRQDHREKVTAWHQQMWTQFNIPHSYEQTVQHKVLHWGYSSQSTHAAPQLLMTVQWAHGVPWCSSAVCLTWGWAGLPVNRLLNCCARSLMLLLFNCLIISLSLFLCRRFQGKKKQESKENMTVWKHSKFTVNIVMHCMHKKAFLILILMI